MLNLAQKSSKVKPTSLKYLYEIAAIPLETREKFLAKLLKRKNASEQKNVKLLKIIYYYLSEDRMLEWDEEYLCNILNISKGMLYCHKSYLLKGLRELYFNWNEIEKTEFSDISMFKNELKFNFEKARRMHEVGMLKESKCILFNILHKLKKESKLTIEKKIILFKVNQYLSLYYKAIKNTYKQNFYCCNAIMLGNMLSKSKLIESKNNFLITIKIDVNLCLINELELKSKNSPLPGNNQRIKLLKTTLELANKIKDYKTQFVLLSDLISILDNQACYAQAIKYTKMGISISKEKGFKGEYYYFKIFLEYFKYRINDRFLNTRIKKILIYYQKALNFSIDANKKISLVFICAILSSACDNSILFYKCIYEYNSYKIIINGLKASLRGLYFMKFRYYFEYGIEFTSIVDKSSHKYLFATGINEVFMKKIESSIFELTLLYNKTFELNFVSEIYMNMLISEFWKAGKSNYKYRNHILISLNRVNKRLKIIEKNDSLKENLVFYSKMIQDSKSLEKTIFLNKYEQKFIHLTQTSNKSAYNYFHFSFVAYKIGYTELIDVVKKTYKAYESINPGMLDTQRTEIENRKLNMESIHFIQAA